MKVSLDRKDELNGTIDLLLEPADYLSNFETQLKEYHKKVVMPGFRPGKVPMGLVKKMYGKGLLADVIIDVINKELSTFLKENELNILLQPIPGEDNNFDIDFQTPADVQFKFDVAFKPQLDIELSNDLTVDYPRILADEEEIEKTIDDLRFKYGSMNPSDIINEHSIISGTLFGLNAQNEVIADSAIDHVYFYTDKIDKKVFDDFNGKQKDDEIDFNPKYAYHDYEYINSIFKGQTKKAIKESVNYRFHVQFIGQMEKAELNEVFFSMLSSTTKIQSETELREFVKRNMELSVKPETDDYFVERVLQKLEDQLNFSLPDDFIKRWMLYNNKEKLTIEMIEKDYPIAVKELNRQLLEDAISKKYGISVTDDVVKDKIRSYYKSIEQESNEEMTDEKIEELINEFFENEKELEKLKTKLQNEAYLDLFLDKLDVKYQDLSYIDFYKLKYSSKYPSDLLDHSDHDHADPQDDHDHTDDHTNESEESR